VAINKLEKFDIVFPINSSGDPALDQQARLYVARWPLFQKCRESWQGRFVAGLGGRDNPVGK